MLTSAMRAEFLERRETTLIALGARQFFRLGAVWVYFDVIPRIEHFRLFLAECQQEIVHEHVVLDRLAIVVVVAADFANVLRGYRVQTLARLEMCV